MVTIVAEADLFQYFLSFGNADLSIWAFAALHHLAGCSSIAGLNAAVVTEPASPGSFAHGKLCPWSARCRAHHTSLRRLVDRSASLHGNATSFNIRQHAHVNSSAGDMTLNEHERRLIITL